MAASETEKHHIIQQSQHQQAFQHNSSQHEHSDFPPSPPFLIPPPQAAIPYPYGANFTTNSQANGEITGVSGLDEKAPRVVGLRDKSIVEAYILAISPLGVLGAHHFYLQRYSWGVLYIFTLGLLGCGWFPDLFRIPCLVRAANAKSPAGEQVGQKSLSDAYVLWFPFGLIGFHHYYLGNFMRAIIYTFTLGGFGIGWIVDGFLMFYLVRQANERKLRGEVEKKNLLFAYITVLPPMGIFGCHHFYLRRPLWGLVYVFTLGLLGFGWIADCFRLPILVHRANQVNEGQRHPQMKTIDDAYILWMPFGFVGFHHFYLGRPVWGFLYFCTLSMLGIGWLIDMVRIPCLVSRANKIREEKEAEAAASDTRVCNATGSNIVAPPLANIFPNYGAAHPSAPSPACRPDSQLPPGALVPSSPDVYHPTGFPGPREDRLHAPDLPPAYDATAGCQDTIVSIDALPPPYEVTDTNTFHTPNLEQSLK